MAPLPEEIVPTAGVLIYRGQEILLVRHGEKAKQHTGVYGLPGGVVEKGETKLQAAIRELEEETGLKTGPENLVEIKKDYSARIERKNETRIYSMAVFLCRHFSGKLAGVPEKVFPEWVPIAKISQYRLLPNVEDAVQEGLRYRV